MIFAMIEIFKGAGLLKSTRWVFVRRRPSLSFMQRAYALRKVAVMPQDLVDAVIAGRSLMGGKHTVLARIVEFAEQHPNDEGAVKAFARLEVNRMQRGIPYLDVIYAAAPLIGLSGTVTGLLQVFSQISPDTGLPDPVLFHQRRGAGRFPPRSSAWPLPSPRWSGPDIFRAKSTTTRRTRSAARKRILRRARQ